MPTDYSETKIKMEDDKVVRVEAPGIPAFRNHTLVDLSASYAGGNATVFEYDEASDQFIRRTTNVKKENGERAIGTQLAPDHPGQPYLRRGEAYKGPAVLFGRKFYTAYQPIFDPQGKTIGILYVGMPIEIYDAMLRHGVESMTLVAGVGILLVLLLSMFLVRKSLEPLGDVTKTITHLAQGSLDTEIAHSRRDDEIGSIARALSVFREATARNRTLEEQERAKADQERQRAAEVAKLTREFEHKVSAALGEVLKTIGALAGDATTMREAAETTKDRASSAAQSAGSASGNVQSVASAAEELAGSVAEIGRQVSSSSDIAARAVREVESTNAQVQELSAAAVKIGEVVNLIQSIAEQTNLLGAQRHDRKRASGRGRPRLRGGGGGGKVAFGSDRAGDRGNRRPNRHHAEGDAIGGRRDWRHFRDDRHHRPHRGGDRDRGRGTECRDAGDCPRRRHREERGGIRALLDHRSGRGRGRDHPRLGGGFHGGRCHGVRASRARRRGEGLPHAHAGGLTAQSALARPVHGC